MKSSHCLYQHNGSAVKGTKPEDNHTGSGKPSRDHAVVLLIVIPNVAVSRYLGEKARTRKPEQTTSSSIESRQCTSWRSLEGYKRMMLARRAVEGISYVSPNSSRLVVSERDG